MLVVEILEAIHPMQRKQWSDLISFATTIRVQNISNYVVTQGTFAWEDAPNSAPPWPLCWIEWRHPQWFTGADGKQFRSVFGKHAMGVLCSGLKLQEGEQAGQAAATFDILKRMYGYLNLSEREEDYLHAFCSGLTVPGWVIVASCFSSLTGQAAQFVLGVDGAGRCSSHFASFPRSGRLCADKTSEAGVIHCWIAPLLMTFSFAHCRNVRIEEQPVFHKPRKMNPDLAPPFLVYKTLHIEPMQRALRLSAPAGTPFKTRLHLCRGHFKDYRGDKALFGKHQGLFWWDMHVRGTIKRGVIVKDYDIACLKGDDDESSK